MHIDGLPLKTIDDLVDIFSHALLGRQIPILCIIFKPHNAQSLQITSLLHNQLSHTTPQTAKNFIVS